MKFKLSADATFEADNLDDAFLKLAQHFASLERGEESQLLLEGNVEINPIEENNNG